MAIKNANYLYEIKKSEGERSAVCKQIFQHFGHTGSLMEFNLYTKLNDEERKDLCQVIFMVEKDASHILFPLIKDQEISTKDAAVYSIYAMKYVTDHCAKHDVPAVDYISTTKQSSTAQTFGFNTPSNTQTIGGCDFYEFSKAQTKTEETTKAKTETPRVQ